MTTVILDMHTVVAFDYIIRFLRSQGWKVKYVRNITDIDDKIIKRANENGESISSLTSRFIDAMNEDFAKLGCLAPDEAPKATDYQSNAKHDWYVGGKRDSISGK